jgi:hypothetical protein
MMKTTKIVLAVLIAVVSAAPAYAWYGHGYYHHRYYAHYRYGYAPAVSDYYHHSRDLVGTR